jgi:hypothetical protein
VRGLIYIFFFSASLASAQVHSIIGAVSGTKKGSGGGVVMMGDITITVNPAQYTDQTVSITADPGSATVTQWRWRILHRYFHTSGRVDTLLHETSSVQNPTFSLDSVGFYDVQLIARNPLQKYYVYQTRIFHVFPPRFDQEDADWVIDMSSGSVFADFRGIDMSDQKVYLKGQTTNGYLELVDLHGTEEHPVYIIKENNNTQVTIQFSGGSGKPLYFSQYSYDGDGDAVPGQTAGQGARYIIFNGFNLDGTPGVKITAGASSTTTVRVEGKLTDVGFYGLEIVSNPLTIDGAAIAIVPTVSTVCQKNNWETNNLQVYHCTITAGEEGVYLGESSQSSGYIGNHGFNPPSGIGVVISRNTVLAAGRDGLQVGCLGGEGEDNLVTDWGQQGDASHEACLVSNDGSFMAWRRNYCRGGDMFANIKSGEYPWAPESGQTSPQPTILESNVYSSGVYDEVGFNEPFAIYGQNNPNSGSGNWQVIARNNIIDADNKAFEFLLALGGFTSYNFNFSNNIVIKVGNAGDSEALNFTGNGKATLQGGTKTENNLVYDDGDSLSGLYFNDRDNGDYKITNVLSAAYAGVPTTNVSSIDYLGFLIPIPIIEIGYFFGAYSSCNLRTLEP